MIQQLVSSFESLTLLVVVCCSSAFSYTVLHLNAVLHLPLFSAYLVPLKVQNSSIAFQENRSYNI